MTTASSVIARVSAAVAGVDDPRERLAKQVGMLQGEIRRLLPDPDPRHARNGSLWCEATIEGLGDCVIHYDYSPDRPGVHTLPNGDPGYPDDPAELCVTVVQIAGCEFDCDVFNEHINGRLENAAWADVEKRQEAADADRYDYARDYE